MLELLRSLDAEDWTKPTDCPAWDVRAMAGHIVGMMETFGTFKEFRHVMWAGRKAAGDGPQIDGITAVQVADRADLTTAELVDQAAEFEGRSRLAAGGRCRACCARPR